MRQNSHLDLISNLEDYKTHCFSSGSLLFNIGNKNFHYTSDIGDKDDLNLFPDHKIDYLITEVTHIKPEEILNELKRNNLPGQIILTHINDEDTALLQKFVSDLPEDLRKKFVLAFDGLKVII
jgi:hypothetical protein